jgi:hypothetical protein
MRLYWCFVCVRLRKPVIYVDLLSNESVQASGYWMRLGICAPSRIGLKDVVKGAIQDGSVNWKKSALEMIRHYDLGPAVGKYPESYLQSGVWYSGGRAYFVD